MITIDDVILDKLRVDVATIPTNPEVMTTCHNVFYKYMEPYVPMQEGVLAHQVEITPNYVDFTAPYAHYMYEGIVYGPNIPIYENGVIVGWFSRPGVSKHPTGAMINYSHEQHSLATHHWDKAMLRDRREEFTQAIGGVIINYLQGGI